MMPLKNKKGIMLIACYLVVVVLSILGSAFLIRSVGEKRIAERERDTIKALYLAEAGIDDAARGLFVAFETDYPNPTPGNFDWFDNLLDPDEDVNGNGILDPDEDVNGNGILDPPYAPPAGVSLDPAPGVPGEGTYTVTIPAVSVDLGEGQADVTLESTGTLSGISRTVSCVIRYNLGPAKVFGYPYFINNLGWFWGGGITANGDIRSNGNFSFGGNPTVNGDIYASENPELGVDGDITGNTSNDTVEFYRNNADPEARPTNPTADPPDGQSYPDGYDGDSERFPNQPLMAMPYLGDLQSYRDLAVAEGGTITQGAAVLVNAVYGDEVDEAGPDGVNGTPDDGCIVLIGTEAEPIEIDGPVVVENDVIVRGVVRGQGIIYSGRNTHVIGDITYTDPPAWPKPDADPEGTDAVNETRDFLGLASKGNLIIGDYTRNDWKSTVGKYLKPPFTQAYNVDASDEDIGYISGYDEDDEPFFDGDYTNTFGTKDDGAGGETPRRYYESSLSDDFINSVAAPSNQIRRVDTVSYNNHAFAGRVGSFTINGNIISRDEAIVYSGSILLNYDIRAKSRGDTFHLPSQLSPPETRSWREN